MLEFMLCQIGNPEILEKYEESGKKVAERKIDGVRVAVIKEADGTIKMVNRRKIDYALIHNLPQLEAVTELLPNDTIADGEVTSLCNPEICPNRDECRNPKIGFPCRNLCQRRCGTKNSSEVEKKRKLIPVFVNSFDVLRLHGKKVESLPYLDRKGLLKDFVRDINHPALQYLGYITKGFRKLFDAEPEGIVAKAINSPYVHKRSFYWLKVKHSDKEVVHVVGFTEGKGEFEGLFGSLVCMREGQYVGNCGGGFTIEERKRLTEILRRCPRLKPSFKLRREVGEPFTMVKTSIKLEVMFQEKSYRGRNYAPRKKGIIYPKH